MAVSQAPCSTCNNGNNFAGGYSGGYSAPGYASGGYPAAGGAGYSVGGPGYSYGGAGYPAGTLPPNAGPYGGAGPANISGGVGYQGFYTNSGGTYDQLYPYDYHESWIRGHWQEMPAYGGFHHFRPYNYKHVLSQSQVAAGWGMSANTPYSQEYFRRAQPQAASSYEPRLSYRRSIPAIEHQEIARSQILREQPQTVPTGLRTLPQGDIPSGYSELPSSSSIDPAVYVRQRTKSSSEPNAEAQRQLRQKQLQAMQQLSPEELKRYAAQYQAAQRQAAERK